MNNFKRQHLLFLVLGAYFVANAIIAEFIGVKIFSLERNLGIDPFSFSFFGESQLSLNLTVGVLLWPLEFVMTDVINEYYGKRGVKILSNLAVGLIIYAFLMVFMGIHLIPADFWPQSHINPAWSAEKQASELAKVGNYNYAYELVFGQGLWIIIGSVIAFLIGQVTDVFAFHKIKKITGEKKVWLRATGSTLISQILDSFVVLFIAFYIGADWSLSLVLAIGVVNYIYKGSMAILLTPLIYLMHFFIDWFLGKSLAEKMKSEAQNS
ncbi:queuosine precursor transporter [Membranihabitans maritimus]|uniref:queuosine precursor transporter n=1 Tax=Membranihabitans maritimus TaxID=2904244 RepID=UPI001F00F412|nr:queuosine precursor transporter [Membranihabitans maritimus]